MFEYIKHLQTKTRDVRKKAAFVIAGVVTSIIFLIWFSTIGLKDVRFQMDKGAIDLAPVENIKDAVIDIYTNFKNLSDNIKNSKDLIKELPIGTATISTTTPY